MSVIANDDNDICNAAWLDYFSSGSSMDPSDCFDAGWNVANQRICQLEQLNATLAAEVDAQRQVTEAAEWWHAEINRTRSTSPFHVALEEFEQGLFQAVSALLKSRYEAAKEQG